MSKKFFKYALFLGMAAQVLASAGALAAPDAKDIMRKNEDARKVADMTSTAVLKTGGGGQVERTKGFIWQRKLLGDNVHYNTFTRFQYPPEVKGEGILFLEHEKGSPDVMIYLPNFKKIRRIQNQDQSSSFMGSEFSYSDIATPHIDDYNYVYIKTEPCGTIKCHVIESTPLNETIRDRTGYSREMHWIREDNFMAAKGEFFDVGGKLLKKLATGNIKIVDPAKKKWLAHHLRMDNVQNGKFTVLDFSAVKVNTGIKDAVFTPQNLEKGN
jgi:hypothetical protein